MRPLTLHSEKFRPEGGAAGQGIMRALGRPRLDHVSVLVREAVQNSWDARVQNDSGALVSVNAKLETFSESEMDTLRSIVFVSMPKNHPLRHHLTPGMRRLTLEDRGTVGLGGPVFVERAPKPSDRFVNFCRIFGRASEGPLGGGTFGYGKAVYFGSSHAATVIIYTRCREGQQSADRLIGMSLWKASEVAIETGRHWWGIPSERHEGATGPVVGNDARKLAKLLGFSPFADDETGTSIMILAPRFDGRLGEFPEMAARSIAESMVIWFWPRMLGGADKLGKLVFSVECDGQSIAVPDPSKDTPFTGYGRALRNIVGTFRKGRETQLPHIAKEIHSARPKARLGYLSIALQQRHPRQDFAIASKADDGPLIEDHAFSDQVDEGSAQPPRCHHVALIRSPGQVIKYVAYRPYPDASMEYCGVFLVEGHHEHSGRPADDVEIAFALSEPPSHDDWVPDELDDDWHKRYVRVAYREIKSEADGFAELGRPVVDAVRQDPLGAMSAELGELLGIPGTGASPAGKHKGKGGSGGTHESLVRLQITGEGTLEELDGQAIFALPFRLATVIEPFAVVKANPSVHLAGGGTEIDPPAGDARPTIVGWRNGKNIYKAEELKVGRGDGGDWQVLVSVPGDAMVGVSLSVE